MEPTENDLCAFIDWLDDQKKSDKSAMALRGLALLLLDDVQAGVPLQGRPREEFGARGGISGIANDPLAAKSALPTRSLLTFFEGNGRHYAEWLQRTGRGNCAPIALRSRQSGQGRSKPMLFWFELEARAEAPARSEETQEPKEEFAPADDTIPLNSGVIAYEMAYCQSSDLTAWGRYIFRNGRLLRSDWRWRLLPIRLVFLTFVVVMLFAFTFLLLSQDGSSRLLTVLIIETVAIAVFVFVSLRTWMRAIDDRLRPAPNELLDLVDPAQIEILGYGKTAEWRLVRYTATCAVCAGEVRVLPGEPDFPRRMVGRCQQSPREHVFSFDRVTLLGGPLIIPPTGTLRGSTIGVR